MRTESTRLAALMLALLFAGAPLALAAEKTTGKDVGQKVDETAHAIRNYSAEQRDEALQSAKVVLADVDARIDHLESRMSRNWGKMNAAARKHATETMKALRRQRQDLSQSYGELKRSSANAWDEVKDGFSKSYDALHDGFEKAAKAF